MCFRRCIIRHSSRNDFTHNICICLCIIINLSLSLSLSIYIYIYKGAQRRPATVPRSTPARLNRIWVESRQCNLSNFSLWTSTRGCAQVWCAPLLNSEAVSKVSVRFYCAHRWELCRNICKHSLGRHVLNRIC